MGSQYLIPLNSIQHLDIKLSDMKSFIFPFRSSVFIQHALLIGDGVMLIVNIKALSLGIIYLSIYRMYTKEKVRVYQN